MKPVQECKNIEDIREAIDELDRQIITLLGERFKYVKEIVKFKEKTKDSIIAHKRREAVIETRRKLAVENGLDPDVIENIYRSLISHFIEVELDIINNSDQKK